MAKLFPCSECGHTPSRSYLAGSNRARLECLECKKTTKLVEEYRVEAAWNALNTPEGHCPHCCHDLNDTLFDDVAADEWEATSDWTKTLNTQVWCERCDTYLRLTCEAISPAGQNSYINKLELTPWTSN